MTSFAQRAVDEAIRIRKLISLLLMDRDTSGADEAGIFAPGEHDIILRYCVGAISKGQAPPPHPPPGYGCR